MIVVLLAFDRRKNYFPGLTALCLNASLPTTGAITFTIPNKVGTGGYAYAPLDPSPIGISFEFFVFPSYLTNVTATQQCLSNWKSLTVVWPPIRIGETTQDRAQYDSKTSAYVVYSVADAKDAPSVLTFGPKFMTLAGTYGGSVVVGLNRGKNNIDNMIAAAKVAVSEVKNLLAIEQNDWNIRVGSAVGKTNIIQAGNWNDAPPKWGASQLIATENATVKPYVRHYARHNYPGGTIQSLMTHSTISNNIHTFDTDIVAAQAIGKEYVFGETNSVSGGGAAGVSPTFGAGLWTMDYALRATYSNMSRTYFHHGTHLLAGASHLTVLDSGSTNYAAYATFDSKGLPLRVLLYISDYYAGSGTRTTQSFTLTGLTSATVRAKRLTAASATSRVDQGSPPSFGGQQFGNGSCAISGTETFETTFVSGGQASFSVKATEALLVYLQ
ncbi:hypothetical protein QBC32DRAFT_371423 [Pseudoneurospora amorphoporcata]|uniref:Beta-glucuronidase C-terminal domain-containing protein n=1 Tax=Pseudoneurospora amorphoporcata TaxID=241081 RepID=A0AAN6NU68_9PEZI|nr:hypothetical protein QBC32DRAFT_371423 [Pseudoneurospora amorphoporcata]